MSRIEAKYPTVTNDLIDVTNDNVKASIILFEHSDSRLVMVKRFLLRDDEQH